MGYVIKGNLRGRLPRNYLESLSGVVVKAYLSQGDVQDSDHRDTKNEHGITLLKERAIASKNPYWIGEAKTDDDGNYEIRLSDAYEDGSIAIDIELKRVPHQKKHLEKTVQCHVKIVQPLWRFVKEDFCFSWSHTFPYAFWNGLRKLFDAWMIFGHVKSSKNPQASMAGLRVLAYDLDWLNDDFLGSAITDTSGYFRIDYSSSDYKQTFLTPLINIETPLSVIPGPGLYFKVGSEDGTLFYEEKSALGKTAARKNASNCFYLDLDIDA